MRAARKYVLAPGLVASAILACSLVASDATAADHDNLEDALPLTVTDALPTNYLNRELQGVLRYTRTEKDEDILFVQPRFELGWPRNTQLSLTLPFVSKVGDATWLGNLRGEILYNLNQETLVLPALALVGAIDVPTGRDASAEPTEGVDPTVRGYLTKSIPGSMYWHRLHVNGSYQFNAQPQPGEREGRYTIAAGYDFRITSSTVGVMDYVREQQMKKSGVHNLVELGVRIQVNPLLVLSLGAGVGFKKESPKARAVGGVQYRAF